MTTSSIPPATYAYGLFRKILMPANFGEWLKAERKKRGWSQQQLADRAGLTKPTISRYETDFRVPIRGRIEMIAAALEMEPHQVLHAAGYRPNWGLPDGEGYYFEGEYEGAEVEPVIRVPANDDDLRPIVEGWDKLTEKDKRALRMMYEALAEDERADSVGGGETKASGE